MGTALLLPESKTERREIQLVNYADDPAPLATPHRRTIRPLR